MHATEKSIIYSRAHRESCASGAFDESNCRQGHYMANVPAMSAICCTLDFPHCSLDLPGFRMPCRAVLSVNMQKSAGSFCSLVLRKSCTANLHEQFLHAHSRWCFFGMRNFITFQIVGKSIASESRESFGISDCSLRSQLTLSWVLAVNNGGIRFRLGFR